MQRSLSTEPILRLEAVRLTLVSLAGPVNILNGIELVIRQGEAVGLVGPSGSGKSTMLMVMSGLERPTSGRVIVNGKELSALGEDEAARFRRGNVGIVFQSFHLIPTMTALENVAVPLELALVPDAFDRARRELNDVGLGHRLDHYPSQLSGGEQQRVALARALAPRPSIIFADEPTGNLDGRTGAEIVEMLFRLQRERNSTLILVTHDEALARRCDRIVRLRDGAIESIEDIDHTPPATTPPEREAVVAPPPPAPEPAALEPAAPAPVSADVPQPVTVQPQTAAAAPEPAEAPAADVAPELANGDPWKWVTVEQPSADVAPETLAGPDAAPAAPAQTDEPGAAAPAAAGLP